MADIRPLHDKVLGYMAEPLGHNRKTNGGVIVTDDTTTETFVRPRWFKVTHIGPNQHDIEVGQYVLVPHGRWSRGVDVDNTMKEQDKLFLIDHNDILGTQHENPVE